MPINIDNLINSFFKGEENGKSDKDKFIKSLANDIATSHKKPIKIIGDLLATDKLARVYFRKYGVDEFLTIINNNIELNRDRITSQQLVKLIDAPMHSLNEISLQSTSSSDLEDKQPEEKIIKFADYDGITFMKTKSFKPIGEGLLEIFSNNEYLGKLNLGFIKRYKLPEIDQIFLNSNARGKGIAEKIYSFILDTFGGLVSGYIQTPGSKKLWVKLAKTYNVYMEDGKGNFYNCHIEGTELKSDVKIYGNTNVLLCFKNTPEWVTKRLKSSNKKSIKENKSSNLNWFKKYESELISDGFEAEFNIAGDNLITIEIIGVPKEMHGKGYGSIIMKTLINYADNNGVVLQLRPAASSTHSRTKLINFYKKFGFIENKGKDANNNYQYMYRLPKNNLVEKILKEGVIKKISLTEAENGKFKYAVVKANVTFPEITEIQDKIEKSDIHQDKDNTMGLEDNPHVTLLYGLHDDVKIEDVKEALKDIELPTSITIKGISIFEREGFDVLKFDVDKTGLSKVNTALRKLPYTNKYDDYKPHITIGYLKKGKADKYINKNEKNINKKINVKNIDFVDIEKKKHKLK